MERWLQGTPLEWLVGPVNVSFIAMESRLMNTVWTVVPMLAEVSHQSAQVQSQLRSMEVVIVEVAQWKALDWRSNLGPSNHLCWKAQLHPWLLRHCPLTPMLESGVWLVLAPKWMEEFNPLVSRPPPSTSPRSQILMALSRAKVCPRWAEATLRPWRHACGPSKRPSAPRRQRCPSSRPSHRKNPHLHLVMDFVKGFCNFKIGISQTSWCWTESLSFMISNTFETWITQY